MTNSDFYIQDNSDIEETKLSAAKKHYNAERYSDALKLFLDIASTSASYKIYYEIGRCYYKLNEFDKAKEYFTNSISLEQYKNPSYLFLGNLYFKTDIIDKAIENWMNAYSYKPDDETVCLNLATSYFSKNMKFQSLLFYEKYLKYAKNKDSEYYIEIKKSIEAFSKTGKEFYQKAQKALIANDTETAIQALAYAANNFPTYFDANYLLGKLYFEQKKYLEATAYLKQAYCLDNKSFDVLKILPYAMLNLGDYTSAYCCFKRLLPLYINNQKEYLDIIQTIKQLETGIDYQSTVEHKAWGDQYFEENNYHFALFEYENCVLIDSSKTTDLAVTMKEIKSFLNPEERIIKACFEKGDIYYSNGDFRQSNKYFTKIMSLSSENSSEYKFAKSRLVNA